jgi:hypothetical protein
LLVVVSMQAFSTASRVLVVPCCSVGSHMARFGRCLMVSIIATIKEVVIENFVREEGYKHQVNSLSLLLSVYTRQRKSSYSDVASKS